MYHLHVALGFVCPISCILPLCIFDIWLHEQHFVCTNSTQLHAGELTVLPHMKDFIQSNKTSVIFTDKAVIPETD